MVELEIGIATKENNMEVPKKLNRPIIRSSNSTPVYISKENENTNSKRYMYPMFIVSLFIIAKILKKYVH